MKQDVTLWGRDFANCTNMCHSSLKSFVILIGDLMAALIFNLIKNILNALSDQWYYLMDFEKFNICVVWGTVMKWAVPALLHICTHLTWDKYTRKKWRKEEDEEEKRKSWESLASPTPKDVFQLIVSQGF